MPGRGRPTNLTREIIDEITKLLPVVLYVESLCDFLGIPRSTFYKWSRRGREELKRQQKEKNKIKPSEVLYVELVRAIKKGLAVGEIRDLTAILRASDGSVVVSRKTQILKDGTKLEEVKYSEPQWVAAAWRLERRFPEKWGRDTSQIKEIKKIVLETEQALDRAIAAGMIPPAEATYE